MQTLIIFLVLVLSAPLLVAQGTVSPPSPVSGMRNKISAGDLLSAESILEVYHAGNGEDGPWLVGLSWLARGALLLGDTGKAELYLDRVRAECRERMDNGSELGKDQDLEIAYGALIEVQTQRLELTGGVNPAVEYLRAELALVKGPASLVSRLNKRLNILTLTNQPAPELEIEDFIGQSPPTLALLRGRPVLLFLWAEWCGDCKAQSASLARERSRYKDRGLEVVALTRYYEEEHLRREEKARIDSVWREVYGEVGTVPMVISTVSMERYGGSSTPTFVFVDRSGIVRRYTPTRLTDRELDLSLDLITR